MGAFSEWFTRSIRPPEEPNSNDPASVPPATVGANVYTPGDPHGVEVGGTSGFTAPPTIVPSAWSGYPAEWNTPSWSAPASTRLGDTAWMCLDLNTSALSTMPPYLVNAAKGIDARWLTNPDPDVTGCWEEFARQLYWDYLLGEAFVLATARYADGRPARFHVVPPYAVNVEMRGGFRVYTMGGADVTADMRHVRYQSSVGDAHGHGPLEVGGYRSVAAELLGRYATQLISNGGIPTSVLTHPEKQSPEQAAQLKADWVAARLSSIGEPAVLSGGITWEAVQMDPEKMSLREERKDHEARIAQLLHVPPNMVGLPASGESMTYSNVESIYDYHWRGHLRPMAQTVMSYLSEWLLPRGTRVELNSDNYTRQPPYERAQTYAILNALVDADGNPAMTVGEIRAAERFDEVAADLTSGVLR